MGCLVWRLHLQALQRINAYLLLAVFSELGMFVKSLIMTQVGVRVEEEELQTGARHHCCSAYLTFVAIRAGYVCSLILIPQKY